jgi:hypothetical protein
VTRLLSTRHGRKGLCFLHSLLFSDAPGSPGLCGGRKAYNSGASNMIVGTAENPHLVGGPGVSRHVLSAPTFFNGGVR